MIIKRLEYNDDYYGVSKWWCVGHKDLGIFSSIKRGDWHRYLQAPLLKVDETYYPRKKED